ELPSAEAIETSPYDWNFLLRGVDGRLHYVVSGTEESRSGIDVSAHQGDIDWHKVRADGISFAIIRLGYRGTESGTIQLDERFRQNLLGAQMAGLNIGVYFYSQATTVAEAEEEADFVLSELGATQLVYPVVFDFEPTGSDGARISGMSADEMFAVAKAFCDRIAASGRTAMLYGNYYDLQDMEYTGLWQYGYWLASYTDLPSADIPFAIWQYSAEGTVSGIDGYVDLDIDLSKVLQASLA
ncbi:MAG: glycoside hydrolase family 25 protein, partial [Atopobiaceae bacterium]|nr:glycoside hydrolase family 25 protein [Atopobiaceae bacterium]